MPIAHLAPRKNHRHVFALKSTITSLSWSVYLTWVTSPICLGILVEMVDMIETCYIYTSIKLYMPYPPVNLSLFLWGGTQR